MTETYEQQPFDPGPFSDNPSQRCPCLLLLNVSVSMSGNPIRELNAGLALLKDELSADPLASKRVQIGVVTFGPVETVTDFVDARHWVVPTLAPKGNTPMGAAIEHGLQMIEAQKPGSTAIAMHRSAMEAEFIQGDKRTGNLAGRGADPAKRSSAAPRRF